jgi:transposase
MNGEAFLAYIEQCLAPTLKHGDIVVADNVSFHKVAGVEEDWPLNVSVRVLV